jgi:multiple sugar transport system substrate-binding protein
VTRYGWDMMGGADNLADVALAAGADFVSADGKTALLNSPAFVETWEQIRAWIHDDQIFGFYPFNRDSWDYWYKTIDDVMQGRAAGYVGSAGDMGDLDFSLVTAHVQPGWGNNPLKPQTECHNAAVCAGASAAEKQAGYKWIAWLTAAEQTAAYAIASGYIPSRASAANTAAFKARIAEQPAAAIPLQQAQSARRRWLDFTGGKVNQAMIDAADLVEIENVPAKQALDQANAIAQQALDEYWAEQGQ